MDTIDHNRLANAKNNQMGSAVWRLSNNTPAGLGMTASIIELCVSVRIRSLSIFRTKSMGSIMQDALNRFDAWSGVNKGSTRPQIWEEREYPAHVIS